MLLTLDLNYLSPFNNLGPLRLLKLGFDLLDKVLEFGEEYLLIELESLRLADGPNLLQMADDSQNLREVKI